MPRKTKQNDITSPDLLAKINPENISLKEEFLIYLRSLKRSKDTIKGYSNDLDIFFVFLVERAHNKKFIDVNKRDIIAYQNYLLYENENSPSRVERLKSTLSSLSNYIENICDDIYPNYRSIIRKVETVKKAPVREHTVLSDEQVEGLLKHLADGKQHQKACVLALAAYSGARKSELLRFKPDFFTDENVVLGSLYKTPKINTKGQSGGKYINKFVLKDDFEPYLDAWMSYRKKNNIESEWLFVKHEKKTNTYTQLKTSTLNSWALGFSKMLDVHFYFHSLRHYWVTALSRRGIPNSVIKQLAGWESEEMVSIYNDQTEEEMFSKYFGSNSGVKDD